MATKALILLASFVFLLMSFLPFAGVHEEGRDNGRCFILLKYYVANDMIIFLSMCYKPSVYAGYKDFSYIVFAPTLDDAGRRWTTDDLTTWHRDGL